MRGGFKSMDGGGKWIAINTGLADAYVQSLVIDPKTPPSCMPEQVQAFSKIRTAAESGGRPPPA